MKTTTITKQIGALLVAASVFAAPNLFAVIYTGTLTLANGSGDAIKATTSGLGNFETFCLNGSVDANSGQTYNYVSSQTITPAGVQSPQPVPAGTIDLGTAWLYSQFRAGTLAGYTSDAASSVALQQAIWYLEGSINGVNNSFVTAAQTALTGLGLGSEFSAEPTSGLGAFGVFALNLTGLDGTVAQPILGLAAVPEPSTVVAGVLLLLPFGVSTMRILRKHKLS
jgi:hypothetical protein